MVVKFKDSGIVHRAFSVKANKVHFIKDNEVEKLGFVRLNLVDMTTPDSADVNERFKLAFKFAGGELVLFFNDVEASKIKNFMLDMAAPSYPDDYFVREDHREGLM